MLVSGDWLRPFFVAGELSQDAIYVASVSGDKIIAMLAFENYNGTNIDIHLCCFSGYIPKELLRFIWDYAFVKCGCVRITALVDSLNNAVIEWIERPGFKEEGRIREMIDGRDLIVYGCLKRDFKYGREKVSKGSDT